MKKKISDSFLPAPLLSCAEGPTAAFPAVLERDPGAGRCGHGSARWRARTRVDTRGHTWTRVDVFGGDGSQLPAGRQLQLFSRNCLLLFLARSRCLE